MKEVTPLHQILEHSQALTVAAIACQTGLTTASNELQKACDIVELRLDSLGWEQDVTTFASQCPLPLLVTARGSQEGGANELTIAQRKLAYQTLLPYASLIDIELRDFPHFIEILEEARANKVIIVGSFHDFEKTPALDELLEKITVLADIHKFALHTNDHRDLGILLELLETESLVSVMGMGPLGSAARPLMGKAGSILNYGFLGDTPTAPGQWPAELLKRTLEI